MVHSIDVGSGIMSIYLFFFPQYDRETTRCANSLELGRETRPGLRKFIQNTGRACALDLYIYSRLQLLSGQALIFAKPSLLRRIKLSNLEKQALTLST